MPSPGIMMTVCFVMIAPKESYNQITAEDAETAEIIYYKITCHPERSEGPASSPRAPRSLRLNALCHAQPPRHQILHSPSNHQRLRHAPQRRERKFLAAPQNRARCKVDINLVPRNHRLFFGRDLGRELFAQPRHKLWHLDAQKSVVERIAQIGLRKTGRNHQRNSLRF